VYAWAENFVFLNAFRKADAGALIDVNFACSFFALKILVHRCSLCRIVKILAQFFVCNSTSSTNRICSDQIQVWRSSSFVTMSSDSSIDLSASSLVTSTSIRREVLSLIVGPWKTSGRMKNQKLKNAAQPCSTLTLQCERQFEYK
jgi:hypothetical protein